METLFRYRFTFETQCPVSSHRAHQSGTRWINLSTFNLDSLPSDILGNIMDNEIPISGGRLNRGTLVRLGDFVLRPAGEDLNVERVIIEVGKVFHGVPKSFGRDLNGRLKLEWIEGDAAEVFDENEEDSRTRLASIGSLLKDLHDSTAGIADQLEPSSWSLVDPSGNIEVICHGDSGPGNIVFREGVAFALIDWELAAPGRRAWDLAIALRFWAPFRDPANMRGVEATFKPKERARLILEGYSAPLELRLECARLLPLNQKVNAEYAIHRVKAKGDEVYANWVAKGGLQRLDRDALWVQKVSEELVREWEFS